jgi:hypothetical protein
MSADRPSEPPKPLKKGVMGNQRLGSSRKSFVRELKRAARARLDKRSPQS